MIDILFWIWVGGVVVFGLIHYVIYYTYKADYDFNYGRAILDCVFWFVVYPSMIYRTVKKAHEEILNERER